jgi:UDP-GlcNAc:undecaprenyl-phosphate GlcNAc-1-phosphate transferase
MQYSVVFASAMLSAFTMPFILEFAHKKSLYDVAGGRKKHNGNIPRFGGVGMSLAFAAVVILFLVVRPGGVSIELASRAAKLWPFAVGAVLMHSIGLLDDFKAQPAKLKLAVQIAAAILVVAAGFRFKGFGFREDVLARQLSWVSIVVSVGWIVGVANAINFIDGLDGLAGTLSLIAALSFSVFYYRVGDASSSFLCLGIAGVIIGFLLFNFPAPKAQIFMGDSGSLFLGFALAVMPFLGQANNVGHVVAGPGLFPSVTLLALPIFDALRVIVRRMREHRNVMTADRIHIHFLFYDSGFSAISVITILGLAGLMQGVVMILVSMIPQSLGYLLEFISFGALGILFRYANSLKALKSFR